MPNTLTTLFTSSPATEPVEAPHPNTGVYVTGTQATVGGPWTVIHANVSKTATPPTMTGRLFNYKNITASIVASGNVLNNVLATPTGSAATGTTATTINVAVSSIANQTGYRLLASDTVGGTYTQIYQGTTASFAHTGLAASQTKYYQWQYVGGGYYDDSALSAAFSGTTLAAVPSAYPAEVFFMGDSKTANPGPGGTSWAVQMALDPTQFPAAGLHIVAVSGECTDQQLARVPTQVIAARNAATYPQAVAWVTPGVNDLRIGDAGTPHAGLYRTKYQIAHDILEMGRQARLNGIKPILMTFGPDRRQYQVNPAEDARMVSLMIDVNNITTANATKYGYVGVMDLTSNALIGAASAPINYAGTYWLTDLIHWNQAGEQYIASRAATLSQQVAATALTAFTDPGEYVVPTGPDTSTGAGVSAYTPYALVSPVFAEVARATVSANSVTGQGFIGANNDLTNYWGVATSQNQAASTANPVIGYIEFIVNDTSKELLPGWNNANTTTDQRDVVYAYHFLSNAQAAFLGINGGVGGIRPYGLGAGVGTAQPFIAYTNGDVLRVQLEQARVAWYQNGVLRFAVALAAAPIGYFLDMAIAPQGVLDDVRMGAANWILRPGVAAYIPGATTAPVRMAAAFKPGINVTVTGNTIKKTAGTTGAFDAGTTGTTAIGTSTATVRGYLDFVANKNGSGVLIGFHAGADADATHAQLVSAGAVCIQVSDTATEIGLRWFVNGAAPSAWMPYAEGDRIKLEVQQSTIVFYQNGAQIGSAAYALPVNSYIDTSIVALNTSITDVYIMADNAVAV